MLLCVGKFSLKRSLMWPNLEGNRATMAFLKNLPFLNDCSEWLLLLTWNSSHHVAQIASAKTVFVLEKLSIFSVVELCVTDNMFSINCVFGIHHSSVFCGTNYNQRHSQSDWIINLYIILSYLFCPMGESSRGCWITELSLTIYV